MNMAEAKQKLMELAEGGFHALEYEIKDHGRGNVSQECTVYLPKHGHFKAAHWDNALAQLEAAVDGKAAISEDLPVSSAETE